MICDFYIPTFFPSQAKNHLVERGNKLLEEQSIEEINEKSEYFFNLLCENKIENQYIINIFLYLIENIQNVPIPWIQCQNIIIQHALNIQNITVAKEALKYLSFYSKNNSDLELQILNGIDIEFLRRNFKSSEINENTFLFLESFLNFSPNTVEFCLNNELYYELYEGHEYTDDEVQIFYNISLIRAALLTFDFNQHCMFLYQEIMQYLTAIVNRNIRKTSIHELICYCIVHCLVKMPDDCKDSCFSSLYSAYDLIVTYWEFGLDKINEEMISINYNLSLIIWACISNEINKKINFMKKRRCVAWIKSHFMTISDNNGSIKFGNEIDDINAILILALISFLKKYPISFIELISLNSVDSDEYDSSFIDKMYDYLLNGNYIMKYMAVQFFWVFWQIPISQLNTQYIYPYFISNNIIEYLILFFEQLDGKPLKSALTDILNMVNSVSKISNNHPILNQIKTEDIYQILQSISLTNPNEEIRNCASLIMKKVFVNSKKK